MVGIRSNTTRLNHIQRNTQIRADVRKWKAVKVNKITAGLQGMRLCKSELNTPSSKVCFLLHIQPFQQATSPQMSSWDSSASSFWLSPCPLRFRHGNPCSPTRERSQSGSTLPGRSWVSPGPSPISNPGELPKAWQPSPAGGQGERGEKEEGPQCWEGRHC